MKFKAPDQIGLFCLIAHVSRVERRATGNVRHNAKSLCCTLRLNAGDYIKACFHSGFPFEPSENSEAMNIR